MKKTIEVTNGERKAIVEIVATERQSNEDSYYPICKVTAFVNGKKFNTIGTIADETVLKNRVEELIKAATHAADIVVGNALSHYETLKEMGFERE